MGQPILKLTHESRDFYLIWSTIVDAPITYGMTLDELREYYGSEYGRKGIEELAERLERVEAKGTSSFDDASAEALIRCNRAGKGETELTMAEIIDAYCLSPRP